MGCLPKVFLPKVRDSAKRPCDEENHNPPSSGECSKGDSGTVTTNSGTHVVVSDAKDLSNNNKAEVIVDPVVVASDGVVLDSPGTILTQSGSVRKPNDLRDFSYQELRYATKSFDRKYLLGEGGFGQVFRGTIRQKHKFGGGEEKIDVAVKQLNSRSQQGHKEWLAEVHFLGLVDCPHLVQLIGYCATDDDERGIQRLLVYEFMPNKGLDDHLFRRGPNCLPWASRVKIVLGAARGLAYLHEELEIQIIFRDFKTSNVLLDETFEPKLSDFGLARQGPQDGDSHVSTAVVGTAGYAAPEYIQTGHLTVKSDVWSFGIVMLEVLTGRRVMDRNRPKTEQRLVEWAKPFINDHHKLFQVVDPLLNGRYPVGPAQKFAQLAYLCLHKVPKHRPKMSEVVEKLKLVQERTVQWESPALHSPSSLSVSQEFSKSSRDRDSPRGGGLTLGSLPSVRSGKVSKFSPRIRDSADVSRHISTLSLEGHSSNCVGSSGGEPPSVMDSPAEKPKLVATIVVEEAKPVDTLAEKPKLPVTTQEEPKLRDTTEEEPKLLVTTKEEPKLRDATEEEPKIPVTTEEEPKLLVTTEEKPKLPVTTEEELRLPITTEEEPKLRVIITEEELKLPVTTEGKPEPVSMSGENLKLLDTTGETPEPVDTSEEPKVVETAADIPKPVVTTVENPKLVHTLVEDPKLGDTVSEEPKLVGSAGEDTSSETVKRRSWGSERLARMSRESGRFTWIPKLYGSLSS